MFRRLAGASGTVLVRTTVGTRAQAEALARRLVDARLAACAHITETSSVYRWKGQRMHETEFMVEARTASRLRVRLVKAMLDGHPYEVPMAESWAVGHVPLAYRQWLGEQVT